MMKNVRMLALACTTVLAIGAAADTMTVSAQQAYGDSKANAVEAQTGEWTEDIVFSHKKALSGKFYQYYKFTAPDYNCYAHLDLDVTLNTSPCTFKYGFAGLSVTTDGMDGYFLKTGTYQLNRKLEAGQEYYMNAYSDEIYDLDSTYRFKITFIPDEADTKEDAEQIDFAKAKAGNICESGNDTDYFKVTFPADGTYILKVKSRVSTKLELCNAEGSISNTQVTSDKSNEFVSVRVAATAGDYYLKVSGSAGDYEVMATTEDVFLTSKGKAYWYENGVRQGTYEDAYGVLGDGTVRGREIYDPLSDGWYWLDACYEGAKAANKEVWMPYIYQNEKDWDITEIRQNAVNSGDMAAQVVKAIQESSGKWVRYDNEGKMVKGWYTVEGTDNILYPEQAGNTYYYDKQTGLMAKGTVNIDGTEYYFDENTGVLQR